MATIGDVAARAGVSVGSVSRVLNGAPNVSEDVRKRVEQAIAELDYRPHPHARSLRSRRTLTLGLLIPDVANPFFAELAKEVERASAAAGYSLILANTDNDPEVELPHFRALADRRVDGLIMVPTTGLSRIPPAGQLPIVLVDRELRGFDMVSSDHEAGMRDAVEHLKGLGHVTIAFVSGPAGLGVADRRRRGYLAVAGPLFATAGVEVSAYLVEGHFDYASGYRAVEPLVALSPRPTAIVCSSDQQAIGVLRACNDLNIRVPDDLAVVGFDDIPLSSLVTPRLTTVSQPLAAIGRAAVERLVWRATEGVVGRTRRILVPTSLVVRESSGATLADAQRRTA